MLAGRCSPTGVRGFCRDILPKREQKDSGMRGVLLGHSFSEKLALPRAAAPTLPSGSRKKQTDAHQQIIINDSPHGAS